MQTLDLKKINLAQFGNLFHSDPAKLSDQELLSMDFLLHRAWKFILEGHLVFFNGEDWNVEDILDLHAEVKEEMNRRGFLHPIKDDLDDQTALRASQTASKDAQVDEIILDDEEEFLSELSKGVRQAFGSYGGKRFLSHRIASYIPAHKTYVEPFAGGAAVFFAKERSSKEALNDRDPEIAFMYRFLKNQTDEDRKALSRRDWVIRKKTFKRLRRFNPTNDRDRFYKNFYLTRASHHSSRIGTINPLRIGQTIDLTTVENVQKRLEGVSVHNKDYEEILKEYDGPDTFFYLDPPYPEKTNVFDFGFNEEEFFKALRSLKAKWIVSYPAERADLFKSFNVVRIKRKKQLKDTWSKKEWAMEILASNFPLKPLHLYIEKELESEPSEMESSAPFILPHAEEPEFLSLEDNESTEPEAEGLEKIQGAFKSPGGKYRLCKKLVRLIPEHHRFVEGFCGGAQVFFHKARSEEEVLNDLNNDLIFAYRFIKNMDEKDLEWLKNKHWTISFRYARQMFESKPRTPRERFYRFMYLNKAHYWGNADAKDGVRHGEKGEGYKIQVVKRLPQIQERLKNVKLTSWDWKEVVKEFDSPNTFFYLDPPYPLHWPNKGSKFGAHTFNEEEVMPTLRKIRGQFLVSYELEKFKLFKGFNRYRIKTAWSGARSLGFRPKFELLVSNFDLKPSKLYVEKFDNGAGNDLSTI